MSSNTYLNDMLDTTSDGNNYSEIAEFYKGLNIFMTGGSGFIGKVLIEKLLRACPKIGKMYLLVRKKKDKSAEERLKEQFDGELYSILKLKYPDFMKHIVIIEGDTSEPELGLSLENKKILIENTHIVFHGAATVRFDEKIRTAFEINVKGTKKMLLLAKEMKNLKAYVHISTAFSQSCTRHVEEKFYEFPIDVEKVISFVELFDDETLARITPALINEWPNNYSFSKACAETLVRQYGKDLPLCLTRPSIVVSTYKDPLLGWNHGIYGPSGLTMAAYLCIYHTEFCTSSLNAELIPVDYVVNNLIAAAWDLGKNWKNERSDKFDVLGKNDLISQEDKPDPIVYNIVSSAQNPVTWKTFFDRTYHWCIRNPCDAHMWYGSFICVNNKTLYNILYFLWHTLPGAILDKILVYRGKQPMFTNLYQKIYKFQMAYGYYKNNEWSFVNNNVVSLWDKMTPTDKEQFVFNVKHIDWDKYTKYHLKGIIKYILKKPLNRTVPFYIKYFSMGAVHYTLMAFLLYSLCWIVYKILSILFSFVLFQFTSPECISF